MENGKKIHCQESDEKGNISWVDALGVLNEVKIIKDWGERGLCMVRLLEGRQSCDFPAWKNRINVIRFLAAMAEKDLLPLTQNVVRGLNDKLYEKRKTAALEIER